jgi:hypothetical protein
MASDGFGILVVLLGLAALNVYVLFMERRDTLRRWASSNGLELLSVERIGSRFFSGSVAYSIIALDDEGRTRCGVAHVGHVVDLIALWRLFVPGVRVEWDEEEGP